MPAYSQEKKEFNPQENQLGSLSQMIGDKINKVRDSIGLMPLRSVGELHKAALVQAEFLSKKGKLDHMQGKKKFRTPMDRVRYFNSGYRLAGENIAYVSAAVVTIVGKDRETEFKTYEEIAIEFVRNWVKSPSHWKNISDARYKGTGIALVYNEKENRIYAVQVFGAK